MARNSSPIIETPREPVPVDRTADDLARGGRITPMLRQYLELKASHEDCLLFFRLGDFYECFFQDAVRASQILDITLTARGKGEDRFAMAGIPHHASRAYIARLVEAGLKVAIADQVEDAADAKGLVRRDVVRVVTPGVVLDEEVLDGRAERLLATVAASPDTGAGPDRLEGPIALALLEVSTGALRATEIVGTRLLLEELSRSGAREVLVAPGCEGLLAPIAQALPGAAVALGREAHFRARRARGDLKAHFGVATLDGFGVPAGKHGALLCQAVVAALRYTEHTQKRAPSHVDRLKVYRADGDLTLDAETLRNLEIVRTLREGRRKGSLLDLVDRTVTAIGGRTLGGWLRRPLCALAPIEARHEAVAFLVAEAGTREAITRLLAGLPDLERVLARLTLGQGSARDLKAVERVLGVLPQLAASFGPGKAADPSARAREALGDPGALPSLLGACGALDEERFEAMRTKLAAALVDDPPPTVHEGGLFREGFHTELDEVIALTRSGKQWLLDFEARERERTGIATLKVRYNRVFGYYLEVSRAKAHDLPADYVRRQTMKGHERFITQELSAHEAKVLSADARRCVLERELFEALREEVVAAAGALRQVARTLGVLDALLGLARVAIEQRWVRPVVDQSRDLLIEAGRHPVIEEALRQGGGEAYVPGDLHLDGETTLLMITGPNMAGKSTVMRKAAIITLLAQAGSFVPAKRARVGLVDRIFTRVGASDDLSRGQSTFMVEMTQTATILHHATDRSLVILDEIGRGTSTFDGLSIAWAVAEHLHDHAQARTLFATHYHELAQLSSTHPRVANFTMAVKEWNEKVIFLRTLVPGAANRSYGIQVARLAGLPAEVLDRARTLLAGLEAAKQGLGHRPLAPGEDAPEDEVQMPLFGTSAGPARLPSEALRLLSELDPDALTPREAHGLLYRLLDLLAVKAP